MDSDYVGYTITVQIGNESETVTLSGSKLSDTVFVPINSNVVINASDIKVVPTEKLEATATLSEDGKTVTLTFNYAINKTTETITAADLGYSATGSRTTAISDIVVSSDGKTVTVKCADSRDTFATGDSFSLTGIAAEDDTFGTNNASSVTLS